MLNLKKSKVMIMSNRTKQLKNRNDIMININDYVFDVVPRYKYLGLVIDKALNFEEHIDYLSGIIKGKIYLLNKALRCIYNCDNDFSTQELHATAGRLQLQDRRNANIATFAHSRKLDCHELAQKRTRSLRSNNENQLDIPLPKM